MTRERRTIAGLGSVVVGALLGMLALTALPWFRSSLGGVLNLGSRPSQLRRTIDFYQGVPDAEHALSFWVSPVYFGWLGLVLLLVAAIAAAVTVGFDPRTSRLVGVVAAVVAVAGFVLTALAIKIVNVDRTRLFDARATPPGYLDYLGGSGPGAWAMALGFLLIAAGALLAAGGRDSFRALLSDGPDEPADAPVVAEATDVPETSKSAEPPETLEPSETSEPDPARPRRDDW